MPLMAGLPEVMPWVRQWHDEIDPAFGASPAHEYDTYLVSQREKYGLTEDDLRGWTPPAGAARASAGRRGMTEVLFHNLLTSRGRMIVWPQPKCYAVASSPPPQCDHARAYGALADLQRLGRAS